MALEITVPTERSRRPANSASMACPEEDVVLRFLVGALPWRHRALVEMHLDGCHHCVALLVAGEQSREPSASGIGARRAPWLPLREEPQAIADYELLRPLGRGGMGIVYDARHGSTGARVALKTICPTTPGADESLRREIQALHRLDHPGVVRIRAEGAFRGVPFYAMDLIEGPSLAAVLARATQRAPSKRLLTLLRRIASTLAHVHAQGIVHRDLTPSNILLRAREEPVLVDFGLVAQFPAAAGRDVLEVGGRTVGTLAYMAPEQIRGQLVDARADLYAFGCILYEALTGRVPFLASQRDAILGQHLEASPCPPSLLAPSISPLLDRMTLRLLAKAPAERTGYAGEVAAALGSLGADDWEDAPASASHAYVHRPRFVGRPDWVAEIDQRLRACRGGRGQRVFIGGESGGGKTRVLAEAATLARKAGFRVVTSEWLATSPHGPTAFPTPPLHPLRPLLRELGDAHRRDPVKARRIFGSAMSILAAYDPDLASAAGAPPPSNGLPRDEATRADLFRSLLRTLEGLSADVPLIVVLDDLQWSDELTLDFLSGARADCFERMRVLVLGAYRTEQISASHRALLQACDAPMVLGPLDDDAILSIARDMLAMPSLPTPLAAMLTRRSRGNPFCVGECLRTAIAEHRLC